ncbi:hypothetical protein HYFRA_00008339 [Hymenoscyphus fraxineus]|uniref:C2H2-type domain-containing protein n=1 Tax=Hymenoscyphus fraxineus TaxID=746836 RepID=A0A9N9PNL7_9HELO|nr:hypothetical protein HYFRA_00008339 [Hymenoscyphus fraxineus]
MDTFKKRKLESLTHTKHRKAPLQQQQLIKPLQLICDFNGCKSTFKCQFNLVRHRSSIHGSKRNCPQEGCQYATGRKDKLNEHIRRMHANEPQEVRQLRQHTPAVELIHHMSSPTPSPQTPQNVINTSLFDALQQQNMNTSSTYPFRSGYEIYPQTSTSSLDMCLNDPYTTFFSTMIFDRLCIETTIPNPSGHSTETDYNSLPSSPLDFNGVGSWVPPSTGPEIYPVDDNDADDEKEYEEYAESDEYYSGNEMQYEYYGNGKEVFPAQEYVTLQEISFRS